MKSPHRRSDFTRRRRISHREAVFHPPERVDFVEKSTCLRKCFFLSSGYEKDGFSFLIDGFELSDFMTTHYIAMLPLCFTIVQSGIIFFRMGTVNAISAKVSKNFYSFSLTYLLSEREK